MKPSLLLLAAALLVGGVARADDLVAAKAHFKAGNAAYKRADYPTAIQEFQAAYAAKPSGVLRYNLAQCYEKLGDIPNALKSYHQYLHETPTAEDRANVEAAMSNLERRLQERGVQQLLVYSEPNAAVVSVDGKTRGATPLSVELPPGPHDLQLTLAGYTTASRRVNISADKSLEIDVQLVKGAAATPPVPTANLTAPPEASSTNTTAPAADVKQTAKPEPEQKPRVYTWIATGVAGAALAGGAVLGMSASSNAKALTQPTGTASHDTNQQHYDSAKSQARDANILYGVAGVAGAAAVTLFFVEGHF